MSGRCPSFQVVGSLLNVVFSYIPDLLVAGDGTSDCHSKISFRIKRRMSF